jgi:DnaJ family protein C protein 3
LRELRADAYLGVGNTIHAISEMRALTKLTNDNTDGFFKLSTLYYQLGEGEESLNNIRECLKLDPEHKDCYPFYKKVKKVAKFLMAAQEAQNNQDWQECIDAAQKILKNEPKIENIRFHGYDKNCHCQLQGGVESTEVIKSCDQALRIREEPRILCDRAEAQLAEDLFDEAVNDYRRALELDENFQRAKEGIETAKKRQKQASKRDYYKILGVRRNAKDREIKKAYRKLAQKWHPDNFLDETEKKAAEKKFMDIAAAKEVLTDDEMRQKYDHGEDPLDPESERGRGFNPFHHGHPQGFPGGGNFQFKFHFN